MAKNSPTPPAPKIRRAIKVSATSAALKATPAANRCTREEVRRVGGRRLREARRTPSYVVPWTVTVMNRSGMTVATVA